MDKQIFTNYLALERSAELISAGEPLSWAVSGAWYTALLYLFPLLLLFQGRGPRIVFYFIYVSGYFIPMLPYQSVVVSGTVDECIYMLSVAGVGLLFAKEIERTQVFSDRFAKVVRSALFKGVTVSLAIAVVFVSVIVNTEQAVEVAKAAAKIADESLSEVQIGLPFLQALVFLFLAAGVYITTSKAQVVFITMSWLVILIPWQFRLEMAPFPLLLDLYVYMSAMDVWLAAAPKGASVESDSTGVSS